MPSLFQPIEFLLSKFDSECDGDLLVCKKKLRTRGLKSETEAIPGFSHGPGDDIECMNKLKVNMIFL